MLWRVAIIALMIFARVNAVVRLLLSLAAAVSILMSRAPLRAADEVVFFLNAPGAFLRGAPSLSAPNIQPVFHGEEFAVNSRSLDNQWVEVVHPKSGPGWIPLGLGEIIKGKLGDLPISARATSGYVGTGSAALPNYVQGLSPTMRAVYARGVAQGRDTSMFTVVGDCNSEPTAYLGRIAAGLYQLPAANSDLQGIINRYSKSFSRISLAARGGFGTRSMLDPSWSDPFFCQVAAGEGAMPCELRFTNASIVFIELGTGDQHYWKEFEPAYRAIVNKAIEMNVVPVLVTKADDLEAQAQDPAPSGYINNVIRKVAAETGAPLLDFWAATRALDNVGLIDEGNQDFHLNPAGSNLHILATLQALDAIARGVPYQGLSAVATPDVVVAPSAPATPVTPPQSASGTFVVQADLDQVNVRAEPSTRAAIVTIAKGGATFALLGRSADGAWVQVDTNGRTGWIFAQLGTVSGAASAAVQPSSKSSSGAPTITINVTAANVRSSPSTQASVVTRVYDGRSYPIIARNADASWVKIAAGWVFAELGDVSGDLSTIAVL